MPPIPCSHCGTQFMRTNQDFENEKLCNNCFVKENLRNTKKENSMNDAVEILIKCSREEQIEVEEICISQSKDFSRYFLELHHASQAAIEEMRKLSDHPRPILMGQMEEIKEESKLQKKSGKK